MKIMELLKEKQEELSESEYNELIDALGYQYGLALAHGAGVKNLEGFTQDELTESLMRQEIVETGLGGYMIIYDMKTDAIALKYKRMASN